MANGYSDDYSSPWLQSPSQQVGRRRGRQRPADPVAQPLPGAGSTPAASAPPGGAPQGGDLFGLRPWSPTWGVPVDDGSGGPIGNGFRPQPDGDVHVDPNPNEPPIHVDPNPNDGTVGIPSFGRGGDPNMPGVPIGDQYGARRPPFNPNGAPFWPTPDDENSPWLRGAV